MAFNPGTLKTSFNSGEIAPEAAGRIELKSYVSGAAYMMRVEPVPQGGFDLMPGTVFESYVRDLLVQLSAPPLTVAGAPVASGGVLASAVVLGAAVDATAIDFSGLTAASTMVVRFEWRVSSAAAWQVMPAFQIDAKPRAYRAALAPGLVMNVKEFRLVRTDAGAAATVGVGASASIMGSAGLSQRANRLTFQLTRTEGYDLVFTDGNCDILKDGVYQCAVATPFSAAQVEALRWEQEKATMLLFHPDVSTQKILRQSDADWLIGAQVWKNVPLVDYGANYVKTADKWRVTLLIPGTNAQIDASTLEFTINGETTTSIALTQVYNVGGGQHLVVAAAIKAAIEALAIVEAGISVTPEPFLFAGTFPFVIEFTGDDNMGELFEISARVSSQVVATAVPLRLVKGDAGGEQVFSVSRGYARDGKFYAQRLVQGGFRSSSSAILASVLSSFFDLNTKIVTADGAVLFRPPSSDNEIIERIVVGRHLLIFTQEAEYFVVDRTLSRTAIPNMVQSSRNGCAPDVPVIVADNAIFWMNRNNSLVFAAAYSEQSQAYDSRAISILASHIVRDMVDAAYQRPSKATDAGRYLLVRSDGLMIVGSVLQEQEITGFVRWATDGLVKRVSVDHREQAKLIVSRTIGGQARLTMERMDESAFLDCCVTVNQALSATVSGLGVHEGREVWAVADGFVTGPFTVSSGQITLDVPAASIIVGRWTKPLARTLPASREIAPNTVMLRNGRITAVRLHVLDTTSIAVGANGQPARDVSLFRAGMAPDVPLPGYSGPLDKAALVGFQRGPQVEITQVRPGRMKVRDLVYELKG